MRAELDNLDSTLVLAGVLEPVDLVNRPNSSIKPNMLLEAIRLFQRSDPDSAQAAMKIVREAIRDPIDGDGDDNKWNRVIYADQVLYIFMSNTFSHLVDIF